jgi:ATP-binding cassette subfamily F protein 3
MKLLRCEQISKSYGGGPILNRVSFDIMEGRRYGLIGANGSGKTTLLSILIGEADADGGSVHRESAVRIGYVPQFPRFEVDQSVRSNLLAILGPLESRLREAEAALAGDDPENLERNLSRYQSARDAWDEAGGDELSGRIDRLLYQAGMADRDETPVGKLSGGEQNILGLLRAMIGNPDILILDEPGNHLDYRGLAWLEAFLRDFSGAVLVVSHNRYLLDRVATDILELRDASLREYRGNYSDYRLARLRDAAAQQAAYAANQKTIARIEEMVKRFAVIAASRPDPAWGKRLRAARSRLAQEHDRAVARPERQAAAINPDFADGATKGDAALRISSFDLKRGEKILLESADLEISRGMRVGLVGPNGCGKTSLLEELALHGSWDHPRLQIVDSLKVGYIRQHPQFPPEAGTLEDLVRSWGPLSRDQAFALLKPMNFDYGEMNKAPGSLSGGEMNRVQIARMMYEKPDLLIMDEPTNHLDIPSREALESALEDFVGTLLVVSHDRYFLDRVADHIAEIDQRRINLFPGSFSEYFHHRGAGLHPASSGKIGRRGKEIRTGSAAKPRPDELQKLEQRIEAAEADLAKREAQISEALERGDHQRGRQLSARLAGEKKILDQLYSSGRPNRNKACCSPAFPATLQIRCRRQFRVPLWKE